MKNKVQNQIFSLYNTIIPKQQLIVVWVSWWPDSMYLLFTLNTYFEAKWRDKSLISIAHFNHGQRKESEKEYTFLKKYSPYNTFYRNKKIPKKWLSETKLREERHLFFQEVIQDTSSKILLLWHNLTDRIETSLLHIVRWCWIEWFLSIKPHSSKKTYSIYRPLLSFPKAVITNLCKENNIPFFVDKTNKKLITPRNILRNSLIPWIQKLHSWWDVNRYESRQKIYTWLDDTDPKTSSSNRQNNLPHNFWGASKWLFANKKSLTTHDWYALFSPTYYISTKKINTIQQFITHATGHMFIWWWYIFIVWDTVHCINGKKDFWKEKHHKTYTIKHYWKQEIDWYTYIIPKGYVWKKARYPLEWDEFKKKRLLKYMINQKIPVFLRNVTPIIIEKNIVLSLLLPKI